MYLVSQAKVRFFTDIHVSGLPRLSKVFTDIHVSGLPDLSKVFY